MTTYSTSLGASLERALSHWRERGALLSQPPAQQTAQTMTIAISRERGAGGSAIAQALGAKLGWPVYDRELVDKIAEDTGVHGELLEGLDEKRPNWLNECLEGFSREKHISGAGFAARLRRILMALYYHGECIVLGRGAAQVLPEKRSLFVRLVAPESVRISRIATRLEITEKEAKAKVAEVDRGRNEFVRSYFHKDPSDPHGYDLTINTASFNEDACVRLLLSALQDRQQEAS